MLCCKLQKCVWCHEQQENLSPPPGGPALRARARGHAGSNPQHFASRSPSSFPLLFGAINKVPADILLLLLLARAGAIRRKAAGTGEVSSRLYNVPRPHHAAKPLFCWVFTRFLALGECSPPGGAKAEFEALSPHQARR